MKKIYNYDRETLELVSEDYASLDPKETMLQGYDVYLIPAYATDKQPPKINTNEAAIFVNNNWQLIADFRGQYIVDNAMQPKKVDKFGELPNGFVVITEEQATTIERDPFYYILSDGKLVKNADYDKQQAQLRKQKFLRDFFLIDGFGYYRKQPKGYQSAVESMNVLFNVANVSNGLQEGLIIFYNEPDFQIAEQCTEEWLINHQIIQPAMTKDEFLQLYIAFMTAWNKKEHTTNEV